VTADDRQATVRPTGASRTVIIHYHLFKNAGTSVDRTLRENFGDSWVGREGEDGALKPDAIADYLRRNEWIRVLSSHTALLPEPHIDGVRVIPVVFLRHPLDRIRSVYDFEHVQDVETPGARAAKRLDIGGYIEWRLERAAVTGDRSVSDFQTFRLAKGGDGARPLERAQRTIERLPFVGLVEEYERSLERLAGALSASFDGVRLRAYRDNVTTADSVSLDARLAALRERIGAAGYERLEAANHDDLVVWETVRAAYRTSAAAARPT
jgi:hypothetical protein